ncbi:MAG TPA: tRNA uridine-5-carboxymethylaminomethyl(34) synthesis GTPase MnmE [Gammaproteobacteria bacterium]|nr:tRNA uridine-5-carboxymethylaminomethyl(34) synthesis GTPase MnmE [Gammaproteobacteria bacterium]
MITDDTIAAIATPPGRGGIGIIRISGTRSSEIAELILGKVPIPRQADFCSFYNSSREVIDQGIALFFRSPHSFTGEDVVELQAHGGPVILDMLLQCCIKGGARIARPGEFSERAFLNDKLDLAQAEAIADLIDASSEQAARAAARSLQGEFSRRVNQLLKGLTGLRMYIEAAIDFPEEEIDFLSDENIYKHLDRLEEEFTDLLNSSRQGTLLQEGITVVIAGRPNVGKSSLLNVLSGKDAAIVTDMAGTTRDVLREHINIDGLPVHIIDTAGLRESENQVERIGIERAWAEIKKADRVLLLVDDKIGVTAAEEKILDQLPAGPGLTIIRNKCDLSGSKPALTDKQDVEITLSARTGEGVDLLRAHLEACVGYQFGSEGEFTARRRHLDALERVGGHIAMAREQLENAKAGELAAEEFREAQQDLAEITGEFSSDDLLGNIFSSFCIGK